jgi:prephenate dehydrogenase
MCGKEIAGIRSADALIFDQATFAFTALPRTSSKARGFADQLAAALGSQPLWLDPHTHDDWTAATSHLPYLVASALCAATPLESAPLIGPGFRSTTRVAATPASVMLDVLETNHANILNGLKGFRQELDTLEDYLTRGDFAALRNELDLCTSRQREILGASNPRRQL